MTGGPHKRYAQRHFSCNYIYTSTQQYEEQAAPSRAWPAEGGFGDLCDARLMWKDEHVWRRAALPG